MIDLFLDIKQQHNIDGCILIFDANTSAWITNAPDCADRRYPPASTFKIPNSLIALEEGVTTTREIFPWDGTVHTLTNWNQNSSLKTAFKNSTVWVYQNIASRIEDPLYEEYLHKISYGNAQVSPNNDHIFWLQGPLEISPQEQINFLVDLHKETLPFSKNTIRYVKDFMRVPDSSFYLKTGYTVDNGIHIGWYVGYKETQNKPIFFATLLLGDKSNKDALIPMRKTLTEEILNTYISRNF